MARAQILIPRRGPTISALFRRRTKPDVSWPLHAVQRLNIYFSLLLPLFFFRTYAEAKACVKNATLTLCRVTEEQVEVVNFYCDTFNPFCFNLSDPPLVKRGVVPRVLRESDSQLPAVTPTQSIKGSADVKSRGEGQSTSLASYRFVGVLSVVVLIRSLS